MSILGGTSDGTSSCGFEFDFARGILGEISGRTSSLDFDFVSYRGARDWSPEHPAGLGAGLSISLSIEGLESFYEV
jgi:hypothetical protein